MEEYNEPTQNIHMRRLPEIRAILMEGKKDHTPNCSQNMSWDKMLELVLKFTEKVEQADADLGETFRYYYDRLKNMEPTF